MLTVTGSSVKYLFICCKIIRNKSIISMYYFPVDCAKIIETFLCVINYVGE